MKRASSLFRVIVFAVLSIVAITASPIVTAQEDHEEMCGVFVEEALSAIGPACAETGRNQLCYGNQLIDIDFRPDTSPVSFEIPGDIVGVVDVQTFALSNLDLENEIWGVALMRIQANLPDTLPGQNVQFVLFGDVELEPLAIPTVEAEVSPGNTVNVRLTASTNARVVDSLQPSEAITLTGRNEAGDWYRIRKEDGGQGWAASFLLSIEADTSELLVIPVEEQAVPVLQAFYLTTGVPDAQCMAAPESGLLIQTPEGVAEVSLSINDVQISLGSTAFIQSAPEENMVVRVVEGRGSVTVDGETEIIPQGGQVTIPVNEDGLASGAPTPVTGYDTASLQALPTALLEDSIEVAEALSEDEARFWALQIPRDGQYRVVLNTCTGGLGTITDQGPIRISGDGAVLTIGASTYNRTGRGTWLSAPGIYGAGRAWSATFVSPTFMNFQLAQDPTDQANIGCTWGYALQGP